MNAERDLVLRWKRVNKPGGRVASQLTPLSWRYGVQQQNHVDRRRNGAEMSDLLLHAVFVNFEIIEFQIGHGASCGVNGFDIQVD